MFATKWPDFQDGLKVLKNKKTKPSERGREPNKNNLSPTTL